MSLLVRKIRGDVRARSAQLGAIALVVALGAGCLVGGLRARAILEQAIDASYAAARAPDVVLRVQDADAAFVDALATREDVEAVHARRIVYARVDAAQGRALPLRLTIADDITLAAVGAVHRHDGIGGPPVGALLIEQSGAPLLDLRAGSSVRVAAPNGNVVELRVAGLAHDTAVAPSTQERVVYAYANRSTAALLGVPPSLDEVWIRATDPASAADLAAELTTWTKARGWTILRADVPERTHPHALLMRAMLRVLGLAGGVGLVAAAALASALVSGWMRRETRSIGIMKAIGATSLQVAAGYLGVIVPVLLAGIVMAVPLAAVVTRLVVRACATLANVDVADDLLTTSLEASWLALALLVPLVAAAPAFVRVLRMPARVAIADAGIGTSGGFCTRHRLRWLRIRHRATWTLALRGTVRRPWRLALILLALASGSALFVTTRSNEASLLRVIDRALEQQGHDVEVVLQRNQPIDRIENVARSVAGVEIAEAWPRVSVSHDADSSHANQATTSRLALVGMPLHTRLFALPVVEGRAPAPGADDEALATRALADRDADVRVGNTIRVAFRERSGSLRVVGLVEEIGAPTLYASAATFARLTSFDGVANAVRVKTQPGPVETAASALERALFDATLQPAQFITRSMVRDSLQEHFNVVGFVLQAVAVAAGLLGTLFLAAVTAAGVMERTRETGVLRALGATRRRIVALLVAEVLATFLAGALLGLVGALPLTAALNDAAAGTLLHVRVPLVLSLDALGLLLAGVVTATLAVALSVGLVVARPAQAALTYE